MKVLNYFVIIVNRHLFSAGIVLFSSFLLHLKYIHVLVVLDDTEDKHEGPTFTLRFVQSVNLLHNLSVLISWNKIFMLTNVHFEMKIAHDYFSP